MNVLPAVRSEAAEDADEIPGKTVEEIQHEDDERHLHQGPGNYLVSSADMRHVTCDVPLGEAQAQ